MRQDPLEAVLSQVRSRLAASARVRALTGAGVSAESGVPTFRGPGGLWRTYRPEDLATPEAFARDPRLVWEWYDWRRGIVAKARPNAAHEALAALERRCRDLWLITQNVDGLHALAGSRRLLPLHGDIWRVRCLGCGGSFEDRRVPLPEFPPRCKECGGLLRPDIVWFGESLPADILDKALQVACDAEVFLVIGTKGAVQPAASLAGMARERGAFVVEVNPEASEIAHVAHAHLRGKAGEVLPLLVGPVG